MSAVQFCVPAILLMANGIWLIANDLFCAISNKPYAISYYADVAQLVEQLFRKQQVVGSIPTVGLYVRISCPETNSRRCFYGKKDLGGR